MKFILSYFLHFQETFFLKKKSKAFYSNQPYGEQLPNVKLQKGI